MYFIKKDKKIKRVRKGDLYFMKELKKYFQVLFINNATFTVKCKKGEVTIKR